MTGIALKKPGATLRQHTYSYNAVSNVTSHTVGGITTSYGYDLADQLISESRLGYVASYTYDANGNRATRTVNGQTETHVSDAADKLMSISVGGNTVRSFTYDGRGRRKTDTYAGSTTTYSWDAESRLTSLARPGVTTSSFGYNGLDARVSKTDSAGTFSFKRNGASVTDAVLSDGAATYTPGISERRAGSSKFLHSGMKNADAQSGASANVDSSRTYDAFGNLTGSSGTWSGPFGYAGGFGYQEDPDHWLRLLGHRYYDSSTGRFISKDPAGAGRNWYGYCANNPPTAVDPQGLDHVVIVVGSGTANEALRPERYKKLLESWVRHLKSQGHTVDVFWHPDPSDPALLLAVQAADGFIFIGHGNDDGMAFRIKRREFSDGAMVDASYFKMHRKRKKLKWLISYSCDFMPQVGPTGSQNRRRWLEVAEEVYAHATKDAHVWNMNEVWDKWSKGKYIGPPYKLPTRRGSGKPKDKLPSGFPGR